MSKIPWTEKTWNPVVGCTKISAGCKHCYAETRARRLKAMGQVKYQFVVDKKGWTGKIGRGNFEVPLARKTSTIYFADSMGDLFHENVPREAIDRMWAVMALTPQHRYLILTKRPERMKDYLADTERLTDSIADIWCDYMSGGASTDDMLNEWCRKNKVSRRERERRNDIRNEFMNAWWGNNNKRLPENIWLGVTAENQAKAEERIPILLSIPAAQRFVSVEPMLGPVSLIGGALNIYKHKGPPCCREKEGLHKTKRTGGLDWVICGCESGAGRRETKIEWIRELRDQCVAAGVPYFLKQRDIGGQLVKMPELDGRVWEQRPGDLATEAESATGGQRRSTEKEEVKR